jgi:tripartite-type tricarboxylate transporter receptor subunit TctC
VAPRGTPQPIVDKLNGLMRGMLAEPAGRKRLVDAFLRPAPPLDPAEFQGFVRQEVPRWERLVRETGVSLD